MLAAVGGQAPQGLGRHRSLHGVEGGGRGIDGRGLVVDRDRVVGVSQVPGQIVHVAEDVATRARRLAVSRGVERVVEEGAARHDAGRLGIVERDTQQGRLVAQVDHRHRVVEAREHVQAVARLVQDQPARPTARRDGIGTRLRRVEAVVFEIAGVEHADLRRTERGHVQGRPVRRERHVERSRQAVILRRDVDRVVGVRVKSRVVEVLVQVPHRDVARPRQDTDPGLRQMSLHGTATVVARPLEERAVRQFGVRHVELVVAGVHLHVEEDRADVFELGCEGNVERIRVHGEDVPIRQTERHELCPVAPERVLPARVRVVEPDDQTGFGSRCAGEVVGGGDRID